MADTTSRGTRARMWVFTQNNPGDWKPPAAVKNEEPKYMIWQREVAPETGTPHIQGYVHFNKQRYMKFVKDWLVSTTVHLEKANGNEKQNHDYCSKAESRAPGDDSGPFEVGVYDDKGGQGKRSDLQDIADDVKQGATRKDIALTYPVQFIRYHQGIQALIQEARPPPPTERDIEVVCLWGATGTGKTHRVRAACPEIYEVTPGRDPWGTYSGQAAIFFDEFDYQQWPIQQMNKYLDKWPCELNCRYYNKYAEWTRVAICANTPPSAWYPEVPHPLRLALFRRITNTVEVLNKEQEVVF